MTPEELGKQFRRASLDTQKRQLMTKALIYVHSQVLSFVPVRTGHLRRSQTWQVVGSGERGRVGSNVPYARSVHFGIGQRARPYLSQGYKAALPGIQRIMRNAGVAIWQEITK